MTHMYNMHIAHDENTLHYDLREGEGEGEGEGERESVCVNVYVYVCARAGAGVFYNLTYI